MIVCNFKIRINEWSIETRFGGLELRLEGLQIASKLRRYGNMIWKLGTVQLIRLTTCGMMNHLQSLIDTIIDMYLNGTNLYL